MNQEITPHRILVVLSSMKEELPELMGNQAWQEISGQFTAMLSELQDAKGNERRQELSASLIELIVPYRPARQRFWEGIHRETKDEELDRFSAYVQTGLTQLAGELGGHGPDIPGIYQAASQYIVMDIPHANAVQRLVTLSKGGVGKAESIKAGNFKLDIRHLSEIAPGVVLAVGEKIIDAGNPILIAAGVLLILQSVLKAMTVEISPTEASVFWGFIRTCEKDMISTEEKIRKRTNLERKKVGLKPLTKDEVRHALHVLQTMKTIRSLDEKGQWQIMEKYRVMA